MIVESGMFVGRKPTWAGLGAGVEEAQSSEEAIRLAGLDWNVIPQSIRTETGIVLEGFQANIRDIDNKVLGITSDKYSIVQNAEAFSFTDEILKNSLGVKYETAGAVKGGKVVWLLAKMPEQLITDEKFEPYVLFANSHDGSLGVKVCMTPIRVACQNTLNLALKQAERIWTCRHKGDIKSKMEEAKVAIFNASNYMNSLEMELGNLKMKKIDNDGFVKMLDNLVPMDELKMSNRQLTNAKLIRNGIERVYFEAPDLQDIEKSAYRFVNAVSDFATHSEPLRKTPNYKENIFLKTMNGNELIDKAYTIARKVA